MELHPVQLHTVHLEPQGCVHADTMHGVIVCMCGRPVPSFASRHCTAVPLPDAS